MPMLNWFKTTEMHDGESIGFFKDDTPFDYNPDCPKCGKTMAYCEVQVGEERYTGRPIIISQFYCPNCGVETAPEEL